MNKAYCLIRSDPVYRREAFVLGLRAAGFEVLARPPVGAPGDVLVLWNRYGGNHDVAVAFERAGGRVLIAENAYCANDRRDRRRYAIAADGHNGSGWWPQGGAERWGMLGVQVKPWRADGDHVLVCPNRSFGMPGFIMHPDWAARTAEALRRRTGRNVRVRPHPGNEPPRRPLADDLAGAWAVVIWSSSAGVEALIEGIPVFCTAPWWICKSATESNLAEIERPKMDDERIAALERLAWAQWTVEEIANGDPFQHLCIAAPPFAGRV